MPTHNTVILNHSKYIKIPFNSSHVSAYSSSSLKSSNALIAMGLSNQEAHRSLRITPGVENTKEEIDYFLKVIPEIISGLIKIPPCIKSKLN